MTAPGAQPRILLIAGRIGSRPWCTGAGVTAVARAIAARGRSVTLLADSIDDPDALIGIDARAFRPYEQTATDFPIRFPRWAARHAADIPHDLRLSLTHRVAADRWFPLDAAPRAWLVHKAAGASPLALAVTLARTPGVLAPALMPRPRRGSPRRLPPFSLLSPADDAQRAAARARLRDLLAIPHRAPVLLLSAPGAVRHRLDHLLAAVASHPDPVVLVALARDAFTLQRRARAIGGSPLLGRLRILTPTLDIRPVLLAADAAVTPFPTALAHRFAADALRLGTPVLGPRGFRRPAPGDAGFTDHRPVSSTPDWPAAVRAALHPGALDQARADAAIAGAALTLDRAVDLLIGHQA